MGQISVSPWIKAVCCESRAEATIWPAAPILSFSRYGRGSRRRRFALTEALRPGLMLFGEWCFALHSVPYKRLPDWFLGFDVYDRAVSRFWSSDRRDRWLNDLGLAPIPRLAQGRLSMEQLLSLIGASRLGEGPMEGIYLRRDQGDWLEQRAKIVRAEFVEGIGKHWSEESLEKNALASISSAASTETPSP